MTKQRSCCKRFNLEEMLLSWKRSQLKAQSLKSLNLEKIFQVKLQLSIVLLPLKTLFQEINLPKNPLKNVLGKKVGVKTSSDGKKIARPDLQAGGRDILLLPDLNDAIDVGQKKPSKDIGW